MTINLMHMSGRVEYVFEVSDLPPVPLSLFNIEITADRVFIDWEQKPREAWVVREVKVAGKSSENGRYVSHVTRSYDWPEWLTCLVHDSHPNPSRTLRV